MRRMIRQRQAFTLIELLVVIGVLAVLGAIAVIGLRALAGQSAGRSTRVTLANLKGFSNDYEATNRYKNIEGIADPATPAIASPADVREGRPGRYGSAVQRTHTLLTALRRQPSVKQAMDRLPSTQYLKDSGGNTLNVLTDAWGNPVVWAPPGGLTGIRIGSGTVAVTAPDNRGFWASAGPDGNFTTGDDNLYSFEN